jgi:hypothetical protein
MIGDEKGSYQPSAISRQWNYDAPLVLLIADG